MSFSFLIRIFLSGLFFLHSVFSSIPVNAQPTGVLERAFFFNDIYNFLGLPLESPPFEEIKRIDQTFKSSCSNLNRIILPFYIHEEAKNGFLIFNLYQDSDNEKPLFSTIIDTSTFPVPGKIGTHEVAGVLFYIWVPPQSNSQEKNYIWRLETFSDVIPIGIGLYLTKNSHPQIQPVRIDGIARDAYTAFYSYCQYNFDWKGIFLVTGKRLGQEKIFLGFLLLISCGILVYIKKLD